MSAFHPLRTLQPSLPVTYRWEPRPRRPYSDVLVLRVRKPTRQYGHLKRDRHGRTAKAPPGFEEKFELDRKEHSYLCEKLGKASWFTASSLQKKAEALLAQIKHDAAVEDAKLSDQLAAHYADPQPAARRYLYAHAIAQR